MEDHRRLIPLALRFLTTQCSDFTHFWPILLHHFNALRLQLFLHSWPSLSGIETHRDVLDHVGFEPHVRGIHGRMRDAQVTRGAYAEYMRNIVGSQLFA